MIIVQIEFTGNDQPCLADVELEGIKESWDAQVTLTGHPAIHALHVKYWLGSFLQPVLESKQDAMFFAPLFEAIEAAAREKLPAEFDQ
ncbi:hypothetical protein [Paraflavitalea pollutisoli]|uniref:hypothetical protein n=1 Tax=Paraflavitalea pollutisoli TaxID=3034143 RepID=UPI0023EDF7AF|nr:hypothetical protein [Paraflavitalea sp. H1-2-19X]